MLFIFSPCLQRFNESKWSLVLTTPDSPCPETMGQERTHPSGTLCSDITNLPPSTSLCTALRAQLTLPCMRSRMVRVTFSPPSDWTLLGSILGVEVKQEYGHVTGIPQEKDENDGSAANQSPAREDGITIHKCHKEPKTSK